jgi:hypothetical protein
MEQQQSYEQTMAESRLIKEADMDYPQYIVACGGYIFWHICLGPLHHTHLADPTVFT